MYCPRLKMNCSHCVGAFFNDRPSEHVCLLHHCSIDKISTCPLHSKQSLCDAVQTRVADMTKRKFSEYQIMWTLVNEFNGELFICVGSEPKFLARLSDNLYYDVSGCYNYHDQAISEICNIFPWDQYQTLFHQKATKILQQI